MRSMTTSPLESDPPRSLEEQAATLYANLTRQSTIWLPLEATEELIEAVRGLAEPGWRVATWPSPETDGVTCIGRFKVDGRPHSRACGLVPHDHGSVCKGDCPTCHPVSIRPPVAGPPTSQEVDQSAVEAGAGAELADFDVDGHRHDCRAGRLAAQTDEVPVCGCAGELFAIGQDAELEVVEVKDELAQLRGRLEELLTVGWFCKTTAVDAAHYAVPAEHLWPLLGGACSSYLGDQMVVEAARALIDARGRLYELAENDGSLEDDHPTEQAAWAALAAALEGRS